MEAAVSARLSVREFPDRELTAELTRAAIPCAAPADVRLDIYEKLDAIECEWRAFEDHADCTVFQSFGWLSTWQRHIGARSAVQPAIVVGRNATGAILFMLPLAARSAGAVRTLTWLGTDLNDYNAPLLAPDFSQQMTREEFVPLWHDILARLKSRVRFDIIALGKMPDMVGAQPNPMLALRVVLNPSGAYATPLAASWDEFYTVKRSSSTRRRDRTKRKRLAEFGEIKLVTADSVGTILVTLDTLAAQKARAFARMGVANLFARPGYKDFYRDLATGERTRTLVHMSRLDVGQHPAAVNLGLTFGDRYYHLLASYDDGDASRFGAGMAHLHDLMRYAIENGYRVFDFTIGDEPYKRDWCDGAMPLYDHVAPVTWRGGAVYLPLITLHWLKRRIKQTPLLWRAFSTARVVAGRLRNGKLLRNGVTAA